MDLLEQPEVKSKYEKCKYIVKLWEHNFKKKHKRLPSKLDIREADNEVKQAYKKYFQLKTTALQQSFRGVDGFSDEELELTLDSSQVVAQEEKNSGCPGDHDDTWGPHLNKIVQEAKQDKVVDKSNLNTSITRKLFCGSKFSKRNPRKSQSFSQGKSDLSFDTSNIVSPYSDNAVDPVTNTTEENDPIFSFEGLFKTNQVKIVDRVHTQSTNIVQSVLENKCKPLKSVDTGWLKRVEQYNCIVSEPQDQTNEFHESESFHFESDDDIIDNSDEDCSLNLGPLAKKPKLAHVEPKPDQLAVVSQENKLPLSNAKTNDCISEMTEKSSAIIVTDSVNNIEKPIQVLSPTQNKSIKTNKSFKTNNSFKRKGYKNNVQVSTRTRQSCRSTMHKKNMNELSSGEEDPYASDTDPKDPEFSVDGKSELVQFFAHEQEEEEREATAIKTKKAKNVIKAKDKNKDQSKKVKKSSKKVDVSEEAKDEDVSQEYELEYSIKPRVSAPRFKNLKKLIKSETTSSETLKSDAVEDSLPAATPAKSKSQQEKAKFLKRIESGSLNENFVTINLKKKVFVRGKKNTNFSRYKVQQWKSKKKAAALAGPDMDMGGCDGGTLTCFQCGQTGHFARNCPNSKGDALLPLEAEDTVCAYPTLEEAAQMAKDSVLAVRKSNLATVASDEKLESDDSSDEMFDGIETEKLLAETLRLEEHVAKLDLQPYMDCMKVVDPVYKLDEQGEIVDTPLEVLQALSMFGHDSFRPGQEQAVMRILSGKSTLVTLSTGSGKSLCYQLPAYLYAKRGKCISLIISPLVSLMEDQVTGIPSFLKAACLHTNKTKIQRANILEALSSGGLDVLLVSPEAVVAGEKSCGFGSLLRKLPPIAFACIDEAHCVSQWSHNFRPSYLMICRVLRERMGVKTILGLTATATRATSDSIINHLQIPDGRDGIISDVPLPDNLTLTVSKDSQRQRALLQLLVSERFSTCKSIIIYCTRREQCDKLAGFLRTSLQLEALPKSGDKKRKRPNYQVEAYHAGLSASKRKSVQNAFMSGNLKIVVATVAFGMGINKSDIRSVIHFNMPKNFESYVQEIGRAGRDGLPAHCHVFLDPEDNDENELRRHIFSDSIDRHMIRKLLQRIFLPCSCKGICPKHEVAFSIEETVKALDLPEENIATLLCYLELHENKYIETLSPAYTVCKIISYGGALGIKLAAKECPPLAMALALQKNKQGQDQNVLEFAVVDIAAAIGWDSGICKSKLKNLEWTTVNGQPKRSPLNVEFSNLGFRLLAPGNLTDEQLDETLDSLHEHVVNQEQKSLLQLRALHQALTDVASPTYQSSLLPMESSERSIKLKTKIREYFESPDPLSSISLAQNQNSVPDDVLIKNIQGLLCTYKDNTFTGRAVARIFNGISSPNYPAVMWGRCKYWRAFINADYHTICKLATREILNFR